MLKEYVRDWSKKSWAWKQGWLKWMKDPFAEYENPHLANTPKHADFKSGWNEVIFCAQVDGGYFDE